MKNFNNIYIPALAAAILFLFCALSTAQTSDELFSQANRLYAGQQYEQALETYKKIEAIGQSAPELFYNMGNSAFRLGRIGLARGYYERALKEGLRNDEDLAFNLNFVRSMLKDPEPENKQAWFKHITTAFSKNTWLYTGLSGYTLIFVLAGIGLVLNGRLTIGFKSAITALALGAMLCAISVGIQHLNPEKSAVISSKQADIMHTPSYTGNTFFTLHEGTKVKVLQTAGNWALIAYSNDRRGWVEAENILTI